MQQAYCVAVPTSRTSARSRQSRSLRSCYEREQTWASCHQYDLSHGQGAAHHDRLSTAARAGPTALAKAVSIDVAKDNVAINNLLPERDLDTDLRRFTAERIICPKRESTFEEAKAKIAHTIERKRLGRPEEFGAACAFLCSVQASYISGQNLQLDGGSYPGLV